jgi:Uma2 family endonuclease
MLQTISQTMTLEEFFALPEGDVALEFIDGQAVPKMSPKFFHARIQKALLIALELWSKDKGRVEPEWAITLQRKGKDWVPVPDLLYISYAKLSIDWMEDEACPTAPELVIEIISPGQTFGELAEKATDYLTAGVDRVWIVDTKAKTITVFYPNTAPQTFKDDAQLSDRLFPELTLVPEKIF